MKSVKQPIIVIMGPTASGKSSAAIKLARKFNGEIISADSRQIYKGMNLGTGKVTGSFKPVILSEANDPSETAMFISEGIAHHLIDIVDPMTPYNVSHFKKDAEGKIQEILKKNKLPIICGGTGFWIDSIIYNMEFPEVKPNAELRKKLETENVKVLFNQLEEMDPQRAKTIDPQNKIRLIRAIEVAQTLGKVPELIKEENNAYDFLLVAIKTEKSVLDEKIKKRLDERFDLGMIDEVKKLHENGVSWKWMEQIGLEYRWIARYLQGKIPLDNEMSAKGGCASGAKEKLYFDIIHYAKRQMTWLRRNENIKWMENYDEIENAVDNFLNETPRTPLR